MRILSSQPDALAASVPPPSSADAALPLLGPSPAMAQLWTQIRRLAPHARTILLTGPANAGQDAVARLLLELSPTPGRTLLELQTAEAELELCSHNPLQSLPVDALLYFPDVDKLSPPAQQGLTRLLHQRRARGLVVVASTSIELRTLVSLGQFREDLFGILSPIRIALPALRRRTEDLPMLLNQMLALHCESLRRAPLTLSNDFLLAAMNHSWPGNLHELQSVAASLAASATGLRHLEASDLHRALGALNTPRPSAPSVRMIPLATVMQEHIHAVLRACRGNKLRAAETLGISRSTLYRMLETPHSSEAFAVAS